jgi:hypothetical protein
MAKGGRRYARDARGRFASTGATARGGRIAKASGKRATVTAKAKGGGKGTIAKPKGLNPGALKPKPIAKTAPVAVAKKRRDPFSDPAKTKRVLGRIAANQQRLRTKIAADPQGYMNGWQPRLQRQGDRLRKAEATVKTLSMGGRRQVRSTTNKAPLPTPTKVGERITGRTNLYKRRITTKRLARTANTISQSKARAKPRPAPASPGASRTRSQAASAQRARSARLVRRTNPAEYVGPGKALKVTRTQTSQGNLLTGKAETVTRRKTTRVASVLNRKAPSSSIRYRYR